MPIIGKANYSSQIGWIKIKTIGLYQNLFDPSSSDNQVDKAVAILYQDELLLVLAAHSGDAINAYFNRLDELKLGNTIELELHQENSTYQITKINTMRKTGNITISHVEEDTLILTTCGKNDDEQLTITAKKVNR